MYVYTYIYVYIYIYIYILCTYISIIIEGADGGSQGMGVRGQQPA